eukprot:TRINITY_DN10837_c0_g1_i1.p1 TRINITY_DN10837_c0_g1~~TRINITY_DN10837_c0_g1_i1.p1  ORF type:complete len:573 (+),score=116.42 TRINITY_DN10837_c0_g1_i1:1152-2870(+)
MCIAQSLSSFVERPQSFQLDTSQSLAKSTMQLLLLCSLLFVAVSAAKKPNFVLLFADDLGIDQINVPGLEYGYTGEKGAIQTPNLKEMAENGLTWQTFYASFHVCSPSRASIMTGRYSIRAGIGAAPGQYAPDAPGLNLDSKVFSAEAVGGLPLNETTIAEALKPAGYRTAAIGKWHLGQRETYLPTNRGFDSYLGIPFSQDMGLSFWFFNDLDPVEPYQPTGLPLLNNTEIIEQPVALDHLVHRYVDAAVDFIADCAKKDEPFFLYLPFNHVHEPNSCSVQFCNSSDQGPVGDAVQEMDWAVGQIMRALTVHGVINDTLTFFTSDNGAPLIQDTNGDECLRDGKASTWEGGFRVPAIAMWPNKIAPGQVTQALGSTMDLFPTFLSLAEVPIPKDRIIDGVDITDLLLGRSSQAHDCIMYYHNAAAVNASGELFAVRCGDHKVYWATHSTTSQPWPDGKQDPPLIFDLRFDPTESIPLPSNSSVYKNILHSITQKRDEHLATIEVVPDQMAKGSIASYMLCADPNSQASYPRYPPCTLTPQNWHPTEICKSVACLATNPNFAKTCEETKGGW